MRKAGTNLVRGECAVEVRENLSCVIPVSKRFDNFQCEFSKDKGIQGGCEDLLCKVWDYCGAIGGEPIFGCEVGLIQAFLKV